MNGRWFEFVYFSYTVLSSDDMISFGRDEYVGNVGWFVWHEKILKSMFRYFWEDFEINVSLSLIISEVADAGFTSLSSGISLIKPEVLSVLAT